MTCKELRWHQLQRLRKIWAYWEETMWMQLRKIGSAIAERAKKAGVVEVLFDRGGRLFHGKVKALADAAREGGLKF